MACLGHTEVRAGVMTVLEDEMWLLMWFLEFQSLGPTPAVSPCSPPLPAPPATLSLGLQGQAPKVAGNFQAIGLALSPPS